MSLFDKSELRGGEFPPHQADGIDALANEMPNPFGLAAVWLLADSVGLGKTPQCCGVIARKLEANPDARILVVVPASLIQQWTDELARWLPTVKVGTFAPKFPERDAVSVLLVSDGKLAQRNMARLCRPWDLVIVDEASAIGSPKIVNQPDPVTMTYSDSKRLACLSEITHHAKHVIGVTATPQENSPVEPYALLDALGCELLPSWAEFRTWVLWDYGSGLEPFRIGGKAPRIPPKPVSWTTAGAVKFRQLLNIVMVRRTASDVEGVALPVRTGPRTIWVPLTPEQQSDYHRAGWINGGMARSLAQSMAGLFSKDGKHSSLVDTAVAYLRTDLGHVSKVLMYAENEVTLDLLESALAAAGVDCLRVDGAVRQKVRQQRMSQHADPDGPRVLIGSKVIERGLNLQYAQALLSLGCSWNPFREEQRTGRIRRIGSPHETYMNVSFLPETPHHRERWERLRQKNESAAAVGLADEGKYDDNPRPSNLPVRPLLPIG